MHISIQSLPFPIQTALRKVGYARKDISVESRESVVLSDNGSDGCRAFTMFVDLASGVSKLEWGSWGGPNIFSAPAVDRDNRSYPVPSNVAIIRGSEGGNRPVYATIVVSPSNMLLALPSGNEVTEREKTILGQFRGLTSAGRKDEWARYPKSKPTEQEIDALVTRKLLARNKAGAISITTDGKNASR